MKRLVILLVPFSHVVEAEVLTEVRRVVLLVMLIVLWGVTMLVDVVLFNDVESVFISVGVVLSNRRIGLIDSGVVSYMRCGVLELWLVSVVVVHVVNDGIVVHSLVLVLVESLVEEVLVAVVFVAQMFRMVLEGAVRVELGSVVQVVVFRVGILDNGLVMVHRVVGVLVKIDRLLIGSALVSMPIVDHLVLALEFMQNRQLLLREDMLKVLVEVGMRVWRAVGVVFRIGGSVEAQILGLSMALVERVGQNGWQLLSRVENVFVWVVTLVDEEPQLIIAVHISVRRLLRCDLVSVVFIPMFNSRVVVRSGQIEALHCL